MKKIWVLGIIPFILYVALLGVMPQMEPDETRYSLIPSEMNQTGDYVTPRIKGTIYLEKPPLVYWATALSFKVLGETDFAARLFTGLCAWGLIILTFCIGRRMKDEETGLYSAAILSVSAFPFMLGRINILDVPLTLFICLAIWTGYRFFETKKAIWMYGFYVACALAFLTKGIIGFAIPGAVLVLWLVWTKQWRGILSFFSPVGLAIFLMIVTPWLVAAHLANADFLWFFFVREHFLRFTTQMHGKSEPFFYFIPIILAGVLPWAAYLIRAWRNDTLKTGLFSSVDNRLLIVWFLFIFSFFTVSSSKLATYVAPVFIPIALFAGAIFRHAQSRPCDRKAGWLWLYRGVLILQALVLLVVAILPVYLKQHTDATRGLVIMISDHWIFLAMIPTMIATAMVFLPDWIEKTYRKGRLTAIYLLSALLLASAVFMANDFLSPYRSSYVAKDAIDRYLPEGNRLYQYRINFYGIDFYNKIETAIVEDFGELADGIVKLDREEWQKRFLLVPEFYRLVDQGDDVYAITQHIHRLQELQERFESVTVLWDNDAFYLVRIHNRKES